MDYFSVTCRTRSSLSVCVVFKLLEVASVILMFLCLVKIMEKEEESPVNVLFGLHCFLSVFICFGIITVISYLLINRLNLIRHGNTTGIIYLIFHVAGYLTFSFVAALHRTNHPKPETSYYYQSCIILSFLIIFLDFLSLVSLKYFVRLSRYEPLDAQSREEPNNEYGVNQMARGHEEVDPLRYVAVPPDNNVDSPENNVVTPENNAALPESSVASPLNINDPPSYEETEIDDLPSYEETEMDDLPSYEETEMDDLPSHEEADEKDLQSHSDIEQEESQSRDEIEQQDSIQHEEVDHQDLILHEEIERQDSIQHEETEPQDSILHESIEHQDSIQHDEVEHQDSIAHKKREHQGSIPHEEIERDDSHL